MKPAAFFLISFAFCGSWTLPPACAQSSESGPRLKVASDSVEARKSQAAARATADRFFDSISRGEIDAAYKELTKNSKIAEKEDEIKALKEKTRQALNMFGEVTGHELVSEESVGAHVARLTYISLGKSYPLRWRFYFYRSDEVWRLIDIRVDDSLVRMFGETAEEKSGQ